jgi:arylsulfatase A-like enzyme
MYDGAARIMCFSRSIGRGVNSPRVTVPLPASLSLLLALMLACGGPLRAAAAKQAKQPNIIIMLTDNLGWGEIGIQGSARGVPTPRLDRLAGQGMRLTNFNVEYSCVVSRAALLTGRYAVRTGAAQRSGITQWEVTIAEALKPLGYTTGHYGKWHLGGETAWRGKREPTNQGFDEWYGIPQSSNEAQVTSMPGYDPAKTPPPYIWEGKAGQPAREVKIFDLETRRTLDRESAAKGIEFMERSVRAGKPFFLYYPITQVHFPTLAHHDFVGSTGAGDIGDALAEVDYNTGLVLDALERLGVANDTIVIWLADNGAELRRPWRGTAGPWTGFYNTVMEGGVRVAAMIRWPGRIPAGQVSNEIVHEIDLFPTLAAAIGADIVPKDRPIDGVNQLPFLQGRQQRSARDTVLFWTENKLVRAVKWQHWKLHYEFMLEKGAPLSPALRLFNLRSDPKEETDVKDFNPGVKSVIDKIVADFMASTAAFPNVPMDAPDPYTPERRR